MFYAAYLAPRLDIISIDYNTRCTEFFSSHIEAHLNPEKLASCTKAREYYIASLRPLVEALSDVDDGNRDNRSSCAPRECP